jgi:Glutathione S-transferase, C-terminal domain
MRANFVMIFDIILSHSPWFVGPLVSGMFNSVAVHYKNDLVAPFELIEAALSDQSPWFAGQKLSLADFCMSWPIDLASQRGYFEKSRTRKWPIGIGEFVNARPTKQLWLQVAHTILLLLIFRYLFLFRFTGIYPP